MFNSFKHALGSVATGAANMVSKVANVLTSDAKIDPDPDTFQATEIPSDIEGKEATNIPLELNYPSLWDYLKIWFPSSLKIDF